MPTSEIDFTDVELSEMGAEVAENGTNGEPQRRRSGS